MQGVLDFSMILGERVFSNREIEYKFELFDVHYNQRKLVETRIKQQVMPYGVQQLFDSHDPDYYWLGKCKSVQVEDDAEYDNLIATLIFDCYPFMIGKHTYFTDIWDNFNFETDVANFTKYNVSGAKKIYLFNASTNSVKPEVVATSNFSVLLDRASFRFGTGKTTNNLFSLAPGMNELVVTGNGSIAFHFRREVMG